MKPKAPPEWSEWERDAATRSLERDPVGNAPALLVLHGLRSDATEDKRRRLAVQLIERAAVALSPRVGWPRFGLTSTLVGQTEHEWLTELCGRLAFTDAEALGPFAPTANDARYVVDALDHGDRYRAAAHLFLRARAFGEAMRSDISVSKQVTALARTLRKSDERRRRK